MFISYAILIILLICMLYEYKTLSKYKKWNENNKSFIATVTHDLKNPTIAQINMLNLLLKGRFGALTPEQYEMIKLTQTSSKYMSNLVGTLLTGYECDSKVLKLNKTEFDMLELIIDVCNENRLLAKEKEQTLVFNPKISQCKIYGDKLQIKRVVTNLISNAITYGLYHSAIEIILENQRNTINFSVKNKSKPVPQKKLKNIFKKFSKTSNSKLNKESSGLGLYIAKKIIDMHRGKIYANCTADGIYTFGFNLKKSQICYQKELTKS